MSNGWDPADPAARPCRSVTKASIKFVYQTLLERGEHARAEQVREASKAGRGAEPARHFAQKLDDEERELLPPNW
jgi:hypothetical protein